MAFMTVSLTAEVPPTMVTVETPLLFSAARPDLASAEGARATPNTASAPARRPIATRFGAPLRGLLKPTSWLCTGVVRRAAPASRLTPDVRGGSPGIAKNHDRSQNVTPSHGDLLG